MKKNKLNYFLYLVFIIISIYLYIQNNKLKKLINEDKINKDKINFIIEGMEKKSENISLILKELSRYYSIKSDLENGSNKYKELSKILENAIITLDVDYVDLLKNYDNYEINAIKDKTTKILNTLGSAKDEAKGIDMKAFGIIKYKVNCIEDRALIQILKDTVKNISVELERQRAKYSVLLKDIKQKNKELDEHKEQLIKSEFNNILRESNTSFYEDITKIYAQQEISYLMKLKEYENSINNIFKSPFKLDDLIFYPKGNLNKPKLDKDNNGVYFSFENFKNNQPEFEFSTKLSLKEDTINIDIKDYEFAYRLITPTIKSEDDTSSFLKFFTSKLNEEFKQSTTFKHKDFSEGTYQIIFYYKLKKEERENVWIPFEKTHVILK